LSPFRNDSTRRSLTDLSVGWSLHQAAFGEVLVMTGGIEQKAHFQCMDLRS
jgi:hypothetical protein